MGVAINGMSSEIGLEGLRGQEKKKILPVLLLRVSALRGTHGTSKVPKKLNDRRGLPQKSLHERTVGKTGG